jgi:hypothetical protein
MEGMTTKMVEKMASLISKMKDGMTSMKELSKP